MAEKPVPGASILLALWLVALVAFIGLPPVPGSDLYWDGLNGLGLAALVGLLLCCWLAPATQASYSVHALRLHISLSLWVVAGSFAHALGLLLQNDVAIEYLKWRAPAYMHAGNIGFVLMVVLSLVSISRVRRLLHSNFNIFRALHRWLSVIVVGLVGWHVVGAGFLSAAGHGISQAFLEEGTVASLQRSTGWRGLLLAALIGITTLLWWREPVRARWRLGHAAGRASSRLASSILGVALISFALLYAGLVHDS